MEFTLETIKNANLIRFEANDDVIIEMDMVEFKRKSDNSWLVIEYGDKAYKYREPDERVLDEIKWLEDKGYYDCTCYVKIK